jgi:hypothetical protein
MTEEPFAHQAWEAIRELEPRLPELRAWMSAMQIAAAAASPENKAAWLSTWRDVEGSMQKLIALLHLLASVIAPDGVLHSAYAYGLARMEKMEHRVPQLQGYLSYVALSAQASTPSEGTRIKSEFGEARYTVELLADVAQIYHDAALSLFGTPDPEPAAKEEGQIL